MIGIETKDCPLPISLKDDGFGSGQLTGYFSTWSLDRAGEVIQKGAFRNLKSFVEHGFILANHDMKSLPVATVDAATMDDTGLLIRGTFHSTPAAQAVRTTVRERLSRGKNCGASIGYRVIDSEPTRINGKSAKLLKSIDLYEVSIVGVACNENARVIEAKRLTPELISVKELGDWLASETKAGRTVSGDNLARLRSHRNELQDGVDLLSAFIDVHNPDSGRSNPFQSIDDSIAASGGRTGGGAAVARAAKTLQTWLEIQKKYGRQLSAEHHRELSDVHARLHFAVEDLGGFLAQHRPGGQDELGASLDKSSNPFLEGFQRIDAKRAKLLELRAKMEELSNRLLIARFEEEERAEAAASKAKSKR